MNLSLKPQVFLTGFLPGFLFIVGSIFLFTDFNFSAFTDFAKEISVFSGIAIIIMSFIVGQFFDSIRDFFIEGLYSFILKNKDINWDFFYKSSEKKADKLSNNYFLFYLVNVNLSIALIGLLIMILVGWPHSLPDNFVMSKTTLIISFAAVIIVLLLDAIALRKEIAKHTKDPEIIKEIPHKNVYTRLGISKIEGVNGVGIIAIIDIPKGTYLFQGDKSDVFWHTKEEIGFDKLPDSVKKMYDDFCIRKERGTFKFGCPDSFNNMPISWYLNDSKSPNVGCDKNYDFFALTDINAGEELVVQYDKYSDE